MMDGLLAFATLTINKLNQIESITYVAVDKTFNRIRSGYSRRSTVGRVTENFANVLNWVREQNVYMYDISRVDHQDGSSTITMHSVYYHVRPQDFYNQFLVERYVNENAVVS